jgi:TonB family protein
MFTRTLKRLLLAISMCCLVWISGCASLVLQGANARGDYATAFKMYRPLAAEGDADAQYNLGLMYYNGRGVTQNYQEALRWFKLSAEQGLARGQYMLGAMYYTGGKVTRDYQEALKWLRLAAAQGHPLAIAGLKWPEMVASEDEGRTNQKPPEGPITLSAELSAVCPKMSAPSYPPLSRRLGEEGELVLRVELDESGHISVAQVIISSGHKRLDDAAMASVKTWRCTPLRRNGIPVRAITPQPFNFVLN